MTSNAINIAFASDTEIPELGKLMADVYSRLEGFPSIAEQPAYYEQFHQLPRLAARKNTDVVIAKGPHNEILGGVVYFSDMKSYGAGGEATTSIKNAAGIRLLAVPLKSQGCGIGRKLTQHCVDLAKASGKSKMILHTTSFMPTAWRLYESMGFVRKNEIDFMQADLEVFGFQLPLHS